MIALRLYDGIIKIINLNTSGRQLQANTQRIEEIQVLDMVFLHTVHKPTLAILYEDSQVNIKNLNFFRKKRFHVKDIQGRHLSTHYISMRGESEVNMDKGPFKQSNVDGEAILVEPVPDPTAGILIVGQVKYLKIMKSITIFFKRKS